jgi:hypothetical protein
VFHAGRKLNEAILEWIKLFCLVAASCPDRQTIKNHGYRYLNLKGFFNIHMEAKCYVRELFTGTDAQWHTSVRNSRILRRP